MGRASFDTKAIGNCAEKLKKKYRTLQFDPLLWSLGKWVKSILRGEDNVLSPIDRMLSLEDKVCIAMLPLFGLIVPCEHC